MGSGVGSLKAYQQINNFTGLKGGQVAGQPAYTAQPQQKDESGIDKASTEILPNNFKTKLNVNIEQTGRIPGYAKRGLKGDPDSNFFEFLKVAKIPYYIGGPMLAWCFKAGGNGSTPRTRQALAGVGFYYLAPIVANLAVSMPLKVFRGVDINHPYRNIVTRRAQNPDGISPKDKEYHKVFESVDFTRWDLLYRTDAEALKNPALVNDNYRKIARKIGIDENLNSPDSAVKPYARKMIIQARAWMTALMVPLVVLGLGMAGQNNWERLDIKAYFGRMKTGFDKTKDGKPVKDIAGGLKNIVKEFKTLAYDSVGTAFKSFWQGDKDASRYFGKVTILGTAALMLAANLNILLTSSAKKKKVIDAKLINSARQNLRNISLSHSDKAVSTGLGGNK